MGKIIFDHDTRGFPEKTDLLETIFNTTQVAILVTRNHKIQYINPEFTILFGYTEEEALGHTVDELITPDAHRDKTEEQNTVEKLISSERIEREEIRCTKDGRRIHVLARLSPIICNNKVAGGFSFYIDISERKQAQEDLRKAHDELELRIEQRTRELKESEKRFRDLFEQSIDAIMIHKNGVIKDSNKSMCELLGYSRDQIINMPVLNLHTESDKQNLMEEVKVRDKFIQLETRWIRSDGSIIDVEMSSNQIDVEEQLYQVIARDITKRKLSEKKLKMSEELNRVLVENVDITLNLIDSNYTILMVNPASASAMGLAIKDVLGKKCYKVIENRDSICPYCLGAKAMETGKPQKDEITVNLPGYELSDMEFQVFPVFSENGKVNGFIETVRDISRAKKDAIALEKAKEVAVQANKAKSEFLANMSHEIRTPLNGIMSVLNLLLSANPDNEQLDLIETGKRSADNLLTIINDVLDFSKIEAGELDLEIFNFNLRVSIAEIVELLALQANNKGLEIIYDIGEEIPSLVRGDPGRLRQILLNLINNAIKFTDNGEVLVSAGLIGETDEKVTVKFEVRDTGIGIPEEKLELVFESFKQTDASTTRMYGGTGLGLSISKKLTELMGGEIGVFSRLGFGSTFWFTVEFEKQKEMIEGKPEPPPDLAGKRILVVDDSRTNQAVLKGYIEAWGCFCDLADSGEMALSMMNAVARVNAPFDAVFIDMHMPLMNGEELGKRIKRDPKLKDTTIILLTSLGMRGDASRMEKIGYAAYLTKPVRRSQLFDSLLTVLSKNRQKESEKKTCIVTKYSISEHRRGKIRILIVEDNIINQKLTLKLVEKFGFQADCVANGKEAIKSLESFKYDIVLMDVQMPEMDGLEATGIIRDPGSKVIDHNVKIIAMTAHAMHGDKERCINAGMNDYTNKPIKPQELLDAIERQTRALP